MSQAREYDLPYSATAVIHRDHLVHNLDVLRALQPEGRVMCMVKANAYGHGLVAVARTLARADSLAVARIEEAAALRDGGIAKPIVLLEGVFDADGMAAAARLDCELVVHTPGQVALLEAAPADARFTVWLKVDSGMNRLGFPVSAFDDTAATLRALPQVRTLRLMSHFASADVEDGAQFADQLGRLAPLLARFDGETSLSNSPAMLRPGVFSDGAAVPAVANDWVRPGIALYGISPFADHPAQALDLRPAMDFETRLIAIRELDAGERVGYGGRFAATAPMRIGIAAAGYGDGYPRRAPDGAPVLVDDHPARIAGRVSMDMLSIDVTAVPGARVGSRVRLWGAGLPAETIAETVDTIAYELVTRVSDRVHRVYV